MIHCNIRGLYANYDWIIRNQNFAILKHNGIRGIANKWLKSYLTNREQFVTIGIIASEQKSVTCGLPQGSVLGPLLFLLYINDFNTAFSVLDLHLIADVSNLFYSKKNLHSH